MQKTVYPVFVSRKIGQDLKVRETQPQIVNQQRVVYHVSRHKQKDLQYINSATNSTAIEVPKDVLRRFSILKSVEISSIVWLMKCFF